MALVIDLKPNEKVIIGSAVITNDKQRTRLSIDGDAPILREKDVMKLEEADSPCRRVYYIIQGMYLADAAQATEMYDDYFKHIKDVQEAAPSTVEHFQSINSAILSGHYYKALKAAKDLIAYEEELLKNVI
jgi:flagellar protein FlbT